MSSNILVKLYDIFDAYSFRTVLSALTLGFTTFAYKSGLLSSLKRTWQDYFYLENKTLIKACHNLDVVSVRKALKLGANVNAVDDNGASALFIVLKQCRRDLLEGLALKIIKILLLAGADFKQCDKDNKSFLYWVIKKDLEGIIPLIPNPTLLNQEINLGEGISSPLMYAVISYLNGASARKLNIIRELLEMGADPNQDSFTDKVFLDAFKGFQVKATPFVVVLEELGRGADDSCVALCNLLLDKGALPFIPVEKKRSGKITFDNYLAKLSPEQIEGFRPLHDRCQRIIKAKSELAFTLPEGIAQIKDEQFIKRTIQEAIEYQAAGGAQTIERLTNLFIQENNTTGIASLIKHMKPDLPGYADFHLQLALGYLGEADGIFNKALKGQANGKVKDISLLAADPALQKQVLDYRQLALSHCLKGYLLSQEKKEALGTINELKRLYLACSAEWNMESSVVESVDMSTIDIIDDVSRNLIGQPNKKRLR